jgi:LCP family protein required for cell wall assembly
VPLALLIVATACAADPASPADSPVQLTTLAPLPEPSDPAATVAPPPTAPPPLLTVAITGDLPAELAAEVAKLYSKLADERTDAASLPDGLIAHASGAGTPYEATRRASVVTEELPNGDVAAVVHVGDDILFAAREGSEWSIVGGALAGGTPWLFDEPGFVLVIGSDARPGQSQPRFRADSIHVLALAPTADSGTIIGFPRDTYISAHEIRLANEVVRMADEDLPPAGIKWTNLMAGRGPELMLEIARVLTDLPIEGYVLTGFVGFDALISELGGLQITLPIDLETGNNWEAFSAGSQLLDPTRALQLARIRKALKGGDFARSLNQGLIMLAGMTMVQNRGIDALPALVRILAENTFTDLDTGALLAYAAAGLLMDPSGLGNIVLPGDVETIDNRSVVLLHEDEKTRVLADAADDAVVAP